MSFTGHALLSQPFGYPGRQELLCSPFLLSMRDRCCEIDVLYCSTERGAVCEGCVHAKTAQATALALQQQSTGGQSNDQSITQQCYALIIKIQTITMITLSALLMYITSCTTVKPEAWGGSDGVYRSAMTILATIASKLHLQIPWHEDAMDSTTWRRE